MGEEERRGGEIKKTGMRQKINKVTEKREESYKRGIWVEVATKVKSGMHREKNREKNEKRKGWMEWVTMRENEEVKERKAGGGGAKRPLHGNSFIRKDLDRQFSFYIPISWLHSPTFLFILLPAHPTHPSSSPAHLFPPSTLAPLTFLFFFLHNVTVPSL